VLKNEKRIFKFRRICGINTTILLLKKYETNKKMKEYEKFYGKIWKAGDSLVITIPTNIIKYSDYKVGDKVKIMIQKNE
jgi:hypothetical protein